MEKLRELVSIGTGTVSAPPPPTGILESLGIDRGELVSLLIRTAVAGGLSFFLIRYMMKHIDPTSAQKDDSRKKARRILLRLGMDPRMSLNAHEVQIATSLVSKDTAINWQDVGGAEELIEQIQDQVLLPLSLPLASCSSLVAAPKGVLLFGPPGCGKTLLAKAVARAAGAAFINLDISTLTDKWYGESQKLAVAVFSLAVKLQPAIIFIDEMDSFLRSRTSNDHEATAMMKAQFMSLWDGFLMEKNRRVVVMGATNRPNDIDPAFLRRLPCRFFVPLPDRHKRAAIIRVILKRDGAAALRVDADLEKVAEQCRGFSGSDLQEVCRLAITKRIKDLITSAVPLDSEEAATIPVSVAHFEYAVKSQKRAKNLDGATFPAFDENELPVD